MNRYMKPVHYLHIVFGDGKSFADHREYHLPCLHHAKARAVTAALLSERSIKAACVESITYGNAKRQEFDWLCQLWEVDPTSSRSLRCKRKLTPIIGSLDDVP